MLQNFYTKFKQSPLAIIIGFVSLSNWQLLFGLRATQWDMINFWLPWRHYIAQCYTNGIVPLWNPYSQAGYPIHGDLQGPAYSLEAILSSFLLPINIYFLNFLYIFYLVLGAYGMYKLILFFIHTLPSNNSLDNNNSTIGIVAAIAGVVFGLCGYNAWHGHYLYITISVCLLPWIYYLFFKILNNGDWKDSLKLALIIWWQITAGNPSFIIVSFYFLIFAFICRFIYNLRKGLKASNKALTINLIITGVASLVLCAPVFLNAYYVFPETSRAGGISLEWAAEENLRWQNVFALISPLAGLERELRAGEVQPIYNLYIGLPTLLFAFYGILKLRSFWINMFSVIAIIATLLSLGLQTPLYKLFHSYFPFFNVFRMPNLIVIYTLIYLVVMSALGLLYILKNKILLKHYLLFAGVIIATFSASILYFKFGYTESQNNHVTDYYDLRSFLWTASQTRKMAISALISFIILVIGYVLIRKNKLHALCLLLLADIGVNYNLGAIARVVGEVSASYSNDFLSGLPVGFGQPDNIQNNKVPNLTNRLNALWMNSATFLEQPVYLNDNNFELTKYMELYNNKKEELNYFIQQPLAFFADSLVKHSDFRQDTLKYRTIATLEDSTYNRYSNKRLSKTIVDQLWCKEFFPQHIVYSTNNKESVAFVLQQNLTQLWKVTLNGKTIHPDLTYYSFPIILIPAGQNTIEFTYEAKHFHLLFAISLLSGILFICLLIYTTTTHKTKRISYLFAFILICSYGGYSFVSGKSRLANSTLEKELHKQDSFFANYSSAKHFINTKDALVITGDKKNTYFNLLFNEEVSAFMHELQNTKEDFITYTCYKSLHSRETETLIRLNFGEPIEEKSIPYGFIRVYKKNPLTTLCIWNQENNFNSEQNQWAQKDSANGNVKMKVMKGNDYAGGVSFIVKEIGAKAHDLVYAECELETSEIEMQGICFSIDRDGANRAFLGYGIVHNNKNGRTALIYRLPEYIRADDKVSVFFWNNTSKAAYIDNFKVQVIKMD